ncbi:hypothetical protein SDC9_153003 [bioreactor metagenome]|uniref:Uncharacterized protein n=1 Tax=bioreactor metagenome TaxID=1076179 RepID=A0A645EWD3_9ZZZZ
MRKKKTSRRTIACITPATGVLPPLLILAMVLAIAPVAGIPPKNGVIMFVIPCPINSVLESCLLPVTPSATIAANNDSIAQRIAIVIAGCESSLIIAKVM